MEVGHARNPRHTSRMVLGGLEKAFGYDPMAFGMDPKNERIVNLTEHLVFQDPTSSIIIFTQYHSEIDILAEALRGIWPDDKNAVVCYHGGIHDGQKSARLALLQSGKVKVFIATLTSAGTADCDWLIG